MNNNRILLVEDDAALGMLLMDFLESSHYLVSWKRDGLSAIDQLKKQSYDLCLLDISMPGMDGFSLARQIKLQFKQLPFLFITARGLKQDKLKAYELGAEDYILKPFDPDELECKIQVILRRSKNDTKNKLPDMIELGLYTFYVLRQELSFDNTIIKLTEKESQILLLLCNHQNKVLRRDDAVKQVYGKSDYFLGRSFDVFISRLRKLLKDDPDILIENVFKVGFIMRVTEKA
ncbi:MAG: response regulator transcription factor [Saprospiraceae bacterium]